MDDFEFEDFPDFISKGDVNCSEVEPDMFFAEASGPNFYQIMNTARRICTGCPYQLECLTYAVENSMEGVWGGTSEGERRQMQKSGKIELLSPDRKGLRIPKDEKPILHNQKQKVE